MESYKFIAIDEAIRRLQELKAEGRQKVIICTVDFDKDTNQRYTVTPDEGCSLVEKANAIIINEDSFLNHLQLFSQNQQNIEDILAKGIMHDVIF